MLGIDRLAYWARQYGFGAKTGIDLPGEVDGHRPDQRLEAGRARRPDLPRRDLPGRHRPGLRRRDAAPADQRLRRARQRRHALPAADRARHHRAGRQGRPAVPAEAHPQAEGQAERPAHDARGRAHNRHAAPHLQPRRPADQDRRQVRHRRVRHAGLEGPPAVLLVLRRLHAEGPVQGLVRRTTTRSSSSWPSPTTRGPRATPRPRSSSTSSSSTTASRRTTVCPRSSSAATSTRTTDGRHPSRARPRHRLGRQVGRGRLARVRPAARRLRGAARRDRAGHGLHEQRRERLDAARGGHDVHARPDVGRDRGDRVHPRDGLRLPLAQDAVLAGLRAPARPARADAGDRRRRRRTRLAGSRSGR